MDPIFRHLAACNNAVFPGGQTALHLDGQAVGWVRPDLVGPLLDGGARQDPAGLDIAPDALVALSRRLAAEGRFRFRDEAFDIRADPDGPVLVRLDRGALPAFGLRAVGVHLNGLVERADGTWLWVARRAMDKLLDPGKLDHIVAGGVPAGLTPAETLVKEAQEEAGLPADLVAAAVPVGIVDYAMERTEGLRQDRLHCYGLVIPEEFQPMAMDGEVAGFELWRLRDVLDRVRATDEFKFNVNLVLIDLFRRRGMLD